MAAATPSPGPTHVAASAVKVLAHPLRARLLAALRRGGPASATTLAAELGTNSGATSYHLRRLEGVGLVEDSREGHGKERLWRAVSEHGSWRPSDLDDDEDTATALDWLERDYVRHFAEKAEQWLDVAPEWPDAWRDHLGLRDHVALVTQEQLVDMVGQLEEVLLKYRRVGQGNPTAKRIAVYLYSYPVDLDKVPGSAGR